MSDDAEPKLGDQLKVDVESSLKKSLEVAQERRLLNDVLIQRIKDALNELQALLESGLYKDQRARVFRAMLILRGNNDRVQKPKN